MCLKYVSCGLDGFNGRSILIFASCVTLRLVNPRLPFETRLA